jgi:protein O-GlcNAc transferase
MNQSEIEKTFASALRHHQAGQLAQARALHEQILAAEPTHAGALHYLGVIAYQSGDLQSAVDLMRRAIALRPGYAEAYNNLATILREMGQAPEAVAAARRAIELKPDYFEGFNTLGNALRDDGQAEEALAAYRRAVALRGDSAAAHNNLGNALRDVGRLEEAAASFARAAALRPDFALGHQRLGDALAEMGRAAEAIAAYRRAIALKADYSEAWNNLGLVLRSAGQTGEAAAAFARAAALRPDFAEAFSNLGMVLRDAGKLDEAIAACRRAIALRPDFAEAHVNLGIALRAQGESSQAIAEYRQAMQLKGDYPQAHSNLVYAMHFDPQYHAAAIAQEQANWNRQYAEPLKGLIKPHENSRDPDRRLRIGYVSPDFREHPVGRFMAPLLSHHDRKQVEVFAYAAVRVVDAMTARLREHVDVWHDTVGLSDQRVAERVREDRIDILVDVTMHMADNRLLVFARKPAPVQVTYLAYCSSTGLTTMDYRLSDPYLDPPGRDESIYSERTIRLPRSYWCYEPMTGISDERGPISDDRGFVTFGSLNNFAKVSGAALSAWMELLRNVPESQLLLHANEGSHRQRVADRLGEHGIDPGRVRFAGFMAAQEYFALYRQIDIALDTFPYGGGTTTCDALWMGVPVISLAGKTGVGRGGVSILSNLGLGELVADSPQMYVRIAEELGKDQDRLSNLRSTLRQRMEKSALMDAPGFARDVEAAYREMWRETIASELGAKLGRRS